jgi:group II intron reverse transcriptase/maturase
MYIRRWLKTSVAHADGRREERQQGTPQGGVISPLLANLFLHYAFDQWIARKAGNIWFERYADDIVCHCQTQKQAQAFLRALERRMEECYLQLHPEKTRIVHCPRPERKEDYATVKFDFLGYEFRPRSVKRKDGEIDWDFRCAISPKAAQSIWETMRSWRFHQHSSSSFKALRDYWVPKIRGWIGYYGAHYASRLHAVLWRFDERLADWLAKKRKLSHSRARASIYRLRQRQPYLFPHWGAQQKWR